MVLWGIMQDSGPEKLSGTLCWEHNIKKKVIFWHLELLNKESCAQNHLGSIVFNKISVLIKLFNDVRKFDNDCEGAF